MLACRRIRKVASDLSGPGMNSALMYHFFASMKSRRLANLGTRVNREQPVTI